MSWVVIIIICVIFVFVSQPVDRVINKKVSSKLLATILLLVVDVLIFMALYGFAVLLGYDIYK